MLKFIPVWKDNINKDVGPSGRGRNKLRTYKLFKQEYVLENYVKTQLPIKHRSALAKFRCGVAPLRLETGRYENIQENLRLCPICKTTVENEIHVLFDCNAYQSIRDSLTTKACEVNNNYVNLCDQDKLIFVLSNEDMLKVSAKTCFMILKTRNNLLYR